MPIINMISNVDDKQIKGRELLLSISGKYSLYDIIKNNPNSYLEFLKKDSEELIFKMQLNKDTMTQIEDDFKYSNITETGSIINMIDIFGSESAIEYWEGVVDLKIRMVLKNDGEDIIINSNDTFNIIFSEIKLSRIPDNSFEESTRITFDSFKDLKTSEFSVINKTTNVIEYTFSSDKNYFDYSFTPGVLYSIESSFIKTKNKTDLFLKGEGFSFEKNFPDSDNFLGMFFTEEKFGNLKLNSTKKDYKFCNFADVTIRDEADKIIFSDSFDYPFSSEDGILLDYSNSGARPEENIFLEIKFFNSFKIETLRRFYSELIVPMKDITGTAIIDVRSDFKAEISGISFDYESIEFVLKDVTTGEVMSSGLIEKGVV